MMTKAAAQRRLDAIFPGLKVAEVYDDSLIRAEGGGIGAWINLDTLEEYRAKKVEKFQVEWPKRDGYGFDVV